MHLGVSANVIPPTLRLFLTTGIMGGFTTYSTFDYETYKYTQQGAYALAALNVGLTLVVCFVAGAAGDVVARLLSEAELRCSADYAILACPPISGA